MDSFTGLISSLPPDPRAIAAGGTPAALSQATPTSSGPAGATAQTGGFVQPSDTKTTASNSTDPIGDTISSWTTGISNFLSGPNGPNEPQALPVYNTPLGVGGLNPALLGLGGMASNPLVPRPGETIDPATGKPHVAGLTRAELEAKRAAEASTAKQATGASATGEKALEELPGKEQAARQLTGTVPVPAAKADLGPHTLLDNVNHGLESVVGLLPQGLKERIAGVNDPKGKMTEQEAEWRLTPQGLLESAKNSSGKIIQEVKDALHDYQEGVHERSVAHAKADEEAGRNPGILTEVKEFIADMRGSLPLNAAQGVAGHESLPSKEVDGAKPGDFSTGVGALPGKSTEAGVAVLPDEKKLLVNQGALPGEVSLTKSALAQEPSSAPSHTATAAVVGGAAGAAGATALAAPLPSTNLGQGAAHGATDLDSIKGVSTTTSSLASADSSPTTSVPGRLAPPGVASGGERTTSLASITAINRGHEGNRKSTASPLVESTLARQASEHGTGAAEAAGAAGVAGVAGGAAAAASPGVIPSKSGKTSTDLKDTAPGRHEDGVGHPSTRSSETTREPGTYPKADLNGPAQPDRHSASEGAASSSAQGKTGTPTPGGLGNAGTVDPTSPRASTVASTEPPQTPKSPTNGPGNVAVVGQDSNTPKSASTGTDAKRRTSSGGSGKKKVGFMSKLKGEMKIISGKLDNDKEKIEAGKKMMHGE